MEIEINIDQVDSIINNYNSEKSMIIPMLQDIQAQYNYLPQAALEHLSEKLSLPMSHTFHIATFFKAFSLKPRGEHLVKVCLGTACHVQGGVNLLERLERELDIKEGGTTYDMRFSLESVRCVGCCGLAPVVVIDEDFHGKLTQDKLPKILDQYKPNS